MTEQEYRSRLKPYKFYFSEDNRLYLVSPDPVMNQYPKSASEDPTGNGIIYRCKDILILRQNGWLDPSDIEDFSDMIRLCMVKRAGLVQRSPNKHDFQSHDDLTFLMFTLKELGLMSLIKQIYEYCQIEFRGPWFAPFKFKYIYNTEEPGIYHSKAFLWRFLNMKAHFDYCYGVKPACVNDLVWKYTITHNPESSDDHTSWNLNYAMVNSIPKGIHDEECEKWEFDYLKAFSNHPKGADGLFATGMGQNHPIGEAFKFNPRFIK